MIMMNVLIQTIDDKIVFKTVLDVIEKGSLSINDEYDLFISSNIQIKDKKKFKQILLNLLQEVDITK